MVNKEVARDIVGIIGNVISFFLFASPTPTIVEIWKSKSVGGFKPDPYIAAIMNCSLWTFYGLPMVNPGSTLVITINSIGLAMELIYVTIFVLYAQRKSQVIKVIGWLLIGLVFLGILVTLTLKFCDNHKQRSRIVGIFSVIFCIIMYASPLTIMRKVIKTKSVEYMPFSLALASFVNAIVWVLYAVIHKLDIFILIANCFGILSGAMQLILYACYYKATLKDDDKKQTVDDELPMPSSLAKENA